MSTTTGLRATAPLPQGEAAPAEAAALERLETALAEHYRAGERRADSLARHLQWMNAEVAATRRALAWLAAFVIVLGLGLAVQRAWRALTWLFGSGV